MAAALVRIEDEVKKLREHISSDRVIPRMESAASYLEQAQRNVLIRCHELLGHCRSVTHDIAENQRYLDGLTQAVREYHEITLAEIKRRHTADIASAIVDPSTNNV